MDGEWEVVGEVATAAPKMQDGEWEVVGALSPTGQALPADQEKFTREFMRGWEGGSDEGEAEAKKAWEREQTNRAPEGAKPVNEGDHFMPIVSSLREEFVRSMKRPIRAANSKVLAAMEQILIKLLLQS